MGKDYKRHETRPGYRYLHLRLLDDDICYEFDLGKPIWLDATIHEFKVHDKARFYQDNFIEHIDFDFLEIQVIEE